MSQEKVDRYKQEKANRQEIIRKEKKKAKITKIVASVICAVLVIWLGYSAYVTINGPIKPSYEVDVTALDDYISTLSFE